MVLTDELIGQGFLLQKVTMDDLERYIDVKKVCYRNYVDEYYGGWVENIQVQMNTDVFMNSLNNSCFMKIILNGFTVGFLSYNEEEDKIDNISIQMVELAQGKGIGSLYLQHITQYSKDSHKPIFLKVFKSNPAQHLYQHYGFKTYSETLTHYLMKYS